MQGLSGGNIGVYFLPFRKVPNVSRGRMHFSRCLSTETLMLSLLRRLSLPEKIVVTGTVIYALVFVAMLILRPGTEASYKDFQNFYQIIPPFLAGVCHWFYSLRTRDQDKVRPWAHRLIGTGCLIWSFGQMTWAYFESIRGVEVPFPGWADVGYLGIHPFMIVGVMLLASLATRLGRLRLLIDSAIAASSVGILSWYFLVNAWWNNSSLPIEGKLLNATYPLGDMASLFVALVLWKSASHDRKSRLLAGTLATGLCLVAMGDSLFSYYTLQDTYHTGAWFDWAFSFGFVVIGYSALIPLWWEKYMPVSAQEAEADNTQSALASLVPVLEVQDVGLDTIAAAARLAVPYILALCAWVVVASHDFHLHHLISTSTYVSGFWVMFLVILRQVMTMLHNQQLAHRLQLFNSSLEQTVVQRTHQIKSLLELTKAVNNTLQASHVLENALIHTRRALDAEAVVIRLCENGVPARAASFLEQGLENKSALVPWLKELELAQEVESIVVPDQESPTMLMRAPLMWHDVQLGDISALRASANLLSDAESQMLESIGLEVAAAYRNSQTHAIAVENADRDSVTGLLNHRAIHERLQTELERAARSNRPLAVIMMDLNNFKLFNDTYGHPVGDQVLKRVALALGSKCRKFDVLGRYGGDEFIAVLPETDLPLAMVVAQRWRERMELEGFHFVGDEERVIPVSLSFGIATYPADSTNRFELISVADANLYSAKLSDRGIVASSENQRQNRQLKTESSFDVLEAMVTAVDNKDAYTRRHSEDVTEFALWIAEEMGLSQATQRIVRLAGLLHDVGKIGVPESVLKKPGRLTSEEFDIMKQHAQFGAFIVGGVPGMEEILPGVRSHHERFDGHGYPDGLAGEAIPFLGRLLAVADAFSAMTTSRPYRQALEWKAALKEIEANIGTQFDPQMANAFLRAARKQRPDGLEAMIPPRLQLIEGAKSVSGENVRGGTGWNGVRSA
ncbi:cyclic di-GMP phosphodiesterase response regulator RpfG [Abditibacteriota bacterium]|nr:cyclic di-GMP phosphodiesterase response regulator RpfG [Abditibacteriota bacterium]